MRILISNDDGVNAPGIAALHQALADYADEHPKRARQSFAGDDREPPR